MDALDLSILEQLSTAPKAGVREYARRLGVSRATVQSRLTKLSERGIITSYSPNINPLEMGFPLTADIHCTIAQTELEEVINGLADIPFVIRADSLAGSEDISCRVVARDHAHLEQVSVMILNLPGVQRIRTDIVLRRRIPHRVLPLIKELQREVDR